MAMKLEKPSALRPGDRVMTVSLSWGGPGAFPQRYAAGKRQLMREFDLDVVEAPHALRDPDWLDRNPKARADDLHAAFTDPNVRGVFATIGGDDSIRLLAHVDGELIRAHPKFFLGYSDTTISHLMCHQAGLASFYGPSIMSGFGENGGMHGYLASSVRRTLFSTAPIGSLDPNPEGWTALPIPWSQPERQEERRPLHAPVGWRFLNGRGVHRGRLLGGCLDVLEWAKGTRLWPSLDAWHGAIFFFETGEDAPPPEFVKGVLRNYGALGILDVLAGMLVGRPGGPLLSVADFDDYDAVIRKVVIDEYGRGDLPIVTRMDFGHTDPMLVLPYGAVLTIDCDVQRLSIDEPAVR
jgi:muramoyltetrapeptide carboxypeptidase LdcA involved in peptidoglycan recycling